MLENSKLGKLGSLIFLLTILVVIGPPGQVNAMDFSVFKDPDDGALDLSEWLMHRHGFLPVPIIITEPAVGTSNFFVGGKWLFFDSTSIIDVDGVSLVL